MNNRELKRRLESLVIEMDEIGLEMTISDNPDIEQHGYELLRASNIANGWAAEIGKLP